MEQMELGFKGGSESADPTCDPGAPCAPHAPLLNDHEY